MNDFYENSNCRLTKKELLFGYNLIKDCVYDTVDINDMSNEYNVDYSRSPGSLRFLLIRMHILVHGMLPLNLNNNPNWFGVPATMIEFAKEHNIDFEYNIECAKIEAQRRPVKIKRANAVKIMSNYYTQNRTWLPKNITKHREQIISKLMLGVPVTETFNSAIGLQ